tara:strand:- start:1513 stop:1749 length:237 start_codon:yes stop_codon:yes gene_type:complete
MRQNRSGEISISDWNEWNKYEWIYELYQFYKLTGFIQINDHGRYYGIWGFDWQDDGYGNIVSQGTYDPRVEFYEEEEE